MRHSQVSLPVTHHHRMTTGGKHLLAALLVGTSFCLAPSAHAQSAATQELYNGHVLPPISGGTGGSKGQYIIPGTRPVTGNGALPSPKLLTKPEDLPSISLPRKAAPSRVAVQLRALPTHTATHSQPQFSGGVVKVIPPVITEVPATVNNQPVQLVQPVQMPFGKASAPLTPKVADAPRVLAEPTPTFAPTPVAKPVTITHTEPKPVPAPIEPLPQAPVQPLVVAAPPAAQRNEIITPIDEPNEGLMPWEDKPVVIARPAPVIAQPEIVQPEPVPAPAPVIVATPAPIVTPEPIPAPAPVIMTPNAAAALTPNAAAALTPQTLDDNAAPVEQVVMTPTPELSEKSRFILNQTPGGIDRPKEVVARSPKPVVIKHENPMAGTIPTIDVRAHEEMGMKIEVRRADPNLNQYLEQGYENLIAGRYEIAAGFYQEVLKIESKNEMALFGLGTTYQKMGHNEEARDVYAKLLSYNPTHREALNNFMALISEEAPAEAIAELEKMEQQSPDFSPIPAQIGIIYSKQGSYAAAAEKLARALNLSPENNAYKYNLAIALDKLGQGEKASELYVELITASNAGEMIPGDVETIRNRVIFLSQKHP